MESLDLINAPLEGINLIEASAGTGKTYTIEGLFVRLILEKQLLVNQILVVTFTKAATEELKERIRSKLLQTKEAFANRHSQDPLIDSLVKKHKDYNIAIRLIQDALMEFDKAAIFTIHGFCNRILYEHAFETGNLFDTELIANPDDLIQEVTEDFWRKNFYEAPLEFISFITNRIKRPSYFGQLLSKIKASEIKIVPEETQPALQNLRPFRNAFKRLRDQWPISRDAVVEVLKNPSLNAALYGSLKFDADIPGMTKRDLKILSMVDAMERIVDSDSTGFPLFNDFEKFTVQKLSQSVRKNQTVPDHKFFHVCDEVYRYATALDAEMEKYLVFLKTQLFSFAGSELLKRKTNKNIQFFDDLLILVKRALEAREGNPLADAIRQKYKAALVDEFQDTDSVQYKIFAKLFSTQDSILFIIGDPKQAIYSFRGADIFSYMEAARNAQAKFTLTENWRSNPRLITAVNTIFSNLKSPFIFEGIPFEKGKPGNKVSSKIDELETPFIFWYLDSREYSQRNKPIGKAEAVPLIASAVAEEICRIISPGPNAVAPGDIAVLVRTNRQTQIVKNYLSAKGIPSVLYSSGNIFDSQEAMELEKILTSIAEPANIAHLKAALVMDMLGVKGQDLVSAETESRWWENRLARFREYFQIWNRYGFIRMFRLLLAQEKVRERLLSFPDGERRLTNVLHLAEILQQESIEKKLGINGLLKWLTEQRYPASSRLEEHQLRLENDEHAVNIITIHKSKGLEYPVVFCPFGWESSLVKGKDVVFHNTDEPRHLTLDLGSAANSKNKIRAQNELLAENIRLLYVALTRAKSRCYLVWGRINTSETSAVAYLLQHASQLKADYRSADIVGALEKEVTAKTDEELLTDLEQLVKKSQGSIQLVPLPRSSEQTFSAQPQKQEKLFYRKFSGKIDRTWKISSYSSLISRRTADIDLPDRDTFRYPFRHPSGTAPEFSDLSQPTDQTDIFAFPKGARAGVFFHDIFEHLDFTIISTGNLKKLVTKKLQEYGIEKIWQKTVCDLINKVLSVPLQTASQDLTLSTILLEDRINEMEFYFPLNPINPQTLYRIFKNHGRLDRLIDFPSHLEKLVFAPAAGFMKGYIDMIFQHRDKFFLLDWKSNHLGSNLESYDKNSLHQTMQENYYILQYHLYTLALYQYLRLRKPHFRYDTDFGGIFYIFIRGVDDTRGSESGIFFDLPDPELINALGKALIPGF